MGRHDDEQELPRTETAPWSEMVLVCGKCLRRQDREELRGELRKALKQAGRRDVRVVLGGCMDLCPKDGIAIARGADLGARPPRVHVCAPDAPADTLARWVDDGMPS
jgi:hypothetical protein